MATDDERRRVAAALREYASFGCGDTEGECYAALADLIEPPARCPHYHSGRHYCSVHEDMALIDRDALLALAEDVDGAADDSGGFEPLAGMLRDIARRIREACGEVDE